MGMADDHPFNRQVARYFRLRSGLNLVELAARCGVHRSTLTRVERGERNPGPKLISAMALALGVDVEELLTKPSDPERAA